MTPMSAALLAKAIASEDAPADFISPRKQFSKCEGSSASPHFVRIAARVSGDGFHIAEALMRAFAGVGGLAVGCAQTNEDAQSRATPERKVLSTEDGTRCLLFFDFVWSSRILLTFRHSGFGLWSGSYFHG